MELARPPADAPWAYVRVAEGCDRACGFCAIPSFRGPQRSRSLDAVLAEVDSLDVAEIVLVSQDLAAYGVTLAISPGSCISWPRLLDASSASVCCISTLGADRSSDRLDLVDRRSVFRSVTPARVPFAPAPDAALGSGDAS